MTNLDFPRAGRCLVYWPIVKAARDCRGCRTIDHCNYYDRKENMNWLNLILFILQSAPADLAAIEGIIAGIKAATPAHQAVVNAVVTAALATPAPTFPGSADATSFPVKP